MKAFKVGLFSILALVCCAYMVTMVTAKNAFFGSSMTYNAIVNDAEGLFEKSLVRVAGIEGGYIESIQLAGDKALIKFKIQKRLKVTGDSRIKIKSIGFLGDRYIDLFLGDPNQERLVDNSEIIVDEGGGLDQVTASAGASMKDLEGIIGKMKEAIENEETDNAMKDIVLDLRRTVNAVAAITNDNQQAITNVMKNLDQMTRGMSTQFNPNNPNSIISKMAELSVVIDNFKDASNSAKEIMASINSGQGVVGKFLTDKETEEQVSDTISNVNKLVSRINSVQSDIEMYSGYNTEHGSKTELGVDLYPTPERFYKLGVVMSDFGPTTSKKKRTSSTTGGVTTVVDEEEQDIDALKFNAQIGRVFQNWGVRGGLIESTGGAGVDLYINKANTKLSADIYDFGSSDGANLRFTGDVRLWNVLYGRATLENTLSKSRSVTVGGGLKISDEDLASIFGFLAR